MSHPENPEHIFGRIPAEEATNIGGELPIFDGFPYLVSKIVPVMYHINLLPDDLSKSRLYELASYQAMMNDFEACLVISESLCVYFYPDGKRAIHEFPPQGGIIITGRLKTRIREIPSTDERVSKLEMYSKDRNPGGLLHGDLTKGGRDATPKELSELSGVNEENVPFGLKRCPICGEWRGECLDPSPQFEGKIMRVHCICDNNNRCAVCGELLAVRKLNGNEFNERDGQIWHLPGFTGLKHKCNIDMEGK